MGVAPTTTISTPREEAIQREDGRRCGIYDLIGQNVVSPSAIFRSRKVKAKRLS